MLGDVVTGSGLFVIAYALLCFVFLGLSLLSLIWKELDLWLLSCDPDRFRTLKGLSSTIEGSAHFSVSLLISVVCSAFVKLFDRERLFALFPKSRDGESV